MKVSKILIAFYILLAFTVISIVIGINMYLNVVKKHKQELLLLQEEIKNNKFIDSLQIVIDIKDAENGKLLQLQKQSELRYNKLKSTLASINKLKNNETKIDTFIRNLDDKSKQRILSEYLSNN